LKDVCCVACLSVDIHKQHSDQVKSVIDVANEEKKRLDEHLQKIQKLQTTFADEQRQLQQMLRSKNQHLPINVCFLLCYFLDIDVSEVKSSQEISKEFDQIISCVQARRKVLEKQLHEKSEVD
jgi:hypothetical protein